AGIRPPAQVRQIVKLHNIIGNGTESLLGFWDISESEIWGAPMFRRWAVAAFVTAVLLALGSTFANAENRIALLIGNSNYASIPGLTSPVRDVQAFAEFLSGAHFQVLSSTDSTQKDLRRAIRDFSAAIEAKGPDTVALLYFSGYGIQYDGDNFLIPADARI